MVYIKVYLALKNIERKWNNGVKEERQMLFKEGDFFEIKDEDDLKHLSEKLNITKEDLSKIISEDSVKEVTFIDLEKVVNNKEFDEFKVFVSDKNKDHFVILQEDENYVYILRYDGKDIQDECLYNNCIKLGKIIKEDKKSLYKYNVIEVEVKESSIFSIKDKVKYFFDFPDIEINDIVKIKTYSDTIHFGVFLGIRKQCFPSQLVLLGKTNKIEPDGRIAYSYSDYVETFYETIENIYEIEIFEKVDDLNAEVELLNKTESNLQELLKKVSLEKNNLSNFRRQVTEKMEGLLTGNSLNKKSSIPSELLLSEVDILINSTDKGEVSLGFGYVFESCKQFTGLIYQDRINLELCYEKMIKELDNTSKTYVSYNKSLIEGINSVLEFWLMTPEDIPQVYTFNSFEEAKKYILENNFQYIIYTLV